MNGIRTSNTNKHTLRGGHLDSRIVFVTRPAKDPAQKAAGKVEVNIRHYTNAPWSGGVGGYELHFYITPEGYPNLTIHADDWQDEATARAVWNDLIGEKDRTRDPNLNYKPWVRVEE